MVYPALLPLMGTPRLPVVEWTDATRPFQLTRPFRRKTKSDFCTCAITFQTQSNTTTHPSQNTSVPFKVKVKYNLIHALRLCRGRTAHRRSRGIALPFHDHGTRRGLGVSITLRPLYTPWKDPVPIVQEAGWAQGRSGQVRKISHPPGFDPWTVQPVASRYTYWATRPTSVPFTGTVISLRI
jgi:hypothetical protein